MAKPTPGPWKITFVPEGKVPPVVIQVRNHQGSFVAELENEYDGVLIAMAPTMLKGLEMAVLEFERIQYQKKCDPEVLAGLKKCIAMAKGEKLHVG